MILPDHAIAAAIDAYRIVVMPYIPASVQPSSYDLRLGPVLLKDTVDGSEEIRLDDVRGYCMFPGESILASTLEIVKLPADITGQLAGKSSIQREYLDVVSDAGYVDPGWHGRLTLELNKRGARPIRLYYGMPIAQLIFHEMAGAAARPYGDPAIGSHYQNSVGPVESRGVAGRAS